MASDFRLSTFDLHAKDGEWSSVPLSRGEQSSADFVLFEVCGFSSGIRGQAAEFPKTGNSALPLRRLAQTLLFRSATRAQPFRCLGADLERKVCSSLTFASGPCVPESSRSESGISAAFSAGLKPRPLSERRTLRVLIAAGGTGGHIFPALAVAQELRSRWAHGNGAERGGCSIEFVGTGRGLESRVIPAAGFPVYTVTAAGLKGMGTRRTLRNLLLLPASFLQTGKLLARLRPDVVVGLGGYVAGPVVLEAALARVPTLLIEPNASPGFTNRVLAPWIRLAALGFKEAAPFYGSKARVTGLPVREVFSRVAPKTHHPPFVIFILGGSQGSLAINSAVTGALPLFKKHEGRFRIIHQTGERDFGRARQAYSDAGVEAEIYAFVDDLAGVVERSDLVVCRSGASTAAELAAAGRASLLIPFPAATDNHQLANARVLENAGAARVIEQRHLSPASLFQEICRLSETPGLLEQMGNAARSLAHPDAAARIAGLIEELAQAEVPDAW
jgi:UDP-N-acetylglucosamine--N-acetylmuramyl-(pentapeptide) pyrophosphoryl-undecaprenol N-acetylglucosamine transferase